MTDAPSPIEVRARGGNLIRGETSGDGPIVLQAHGITATRRYVTHGSKLLERRGFRAAMYDARGHGRSDPAPEGEGYAYEILARDMGEVVDSLAGADGRVVVAGHSMGAHTATAYAMAYPERVAGLVVIGPVSLGAPPSDSSIEYWNGLADGLAEGGVDGFMEVYDDGSHKDDWRETILRLARQRLELHDHPEAVADALREVPGSLPFSGADALAEVQVPTLVVASRDEADPGHPYDVAVEWAERIPGARMISEDEGESPLAWQGGKLSREIAAFCDDDAVASRL